MAFEFKLPDIGEGVVEGELVKWLVEEGQEVAEDTPLFEVLTDKVSAVIPSPRKGVVTALHFKEGDMVPVGAVVVTIDAAGAAPAAVKAPEKAAEKPAEKAGAEKPADKTGAEKPAEKTGAEKPRAQQAEPRAEPVEPEVDEATRAPGERVRAAPATRKLARELGVDLARVQGSGEQGRVTREDVEKWAAQAAAPTAQPEARAKAAPRALERGPDEERVKLKGLRRRIATKMREAKDYAAHFTYVEEVDFTDVSALRDALAERGLKTTFLPFVMKAVVLALKKPEFRMLNAHMDDAAGEIVLKNRFHLGVAAATDAGLLVPVVRDVDQKSIRELTDAVKRAGEGARGGTLAADELSGSTFTITSLGKIGGMFATPIINYPETAILGLHKVEKRPVVVGDQIVIRERMYMSCSFDHRLIDGHVGAAFVQAVKDYIESPALLMAELS